MDRIYFRQLIVYGEAMTYDLTGRHKLPTVVDQLHAAGLKLSLRATRQHISRERANAE